MAQERSEKHKCGCRSTDSRWVFQCETHKAETDEIHQRWRREREEAGQPAVLS